MLKIVFIGHRDLYFGAEAVLFRVLSLLKYKGIATPLIVLPKTAANGFRSKCNTDHIAPVKRFSYKLLNGSYSRSLICLVYNTPALLKLFGHYRKEHIDVIYTNTIVNIIGPFLALLLHKRHLWHFHEQPDAECFKWIPPGLFPLYRFLINRKGTTIIFISITQKVLWEKTLSIKIENSSVIYTPPAKISGATIGVDSAAISKTELITYGFLGSWTPSKNLLSLLEAFAKLQLNYPDSKIHLILMGGGELENVIKSKITILGLQNHVTLLPHSTAILPFFSKINIFVLPSWFESWGLAALEAVEQKKPLILTSNTALKELFKPGEDCLFINPYQEESLYKAMEQLLLNPEASIRMADHAFSTLQLLNLNTQFEASIVSLFK